MKEELKEFLNKYTANDVANNVDAAVELQIFYKASFNKNIDCLTCDSKLIRAYNELQQYSLTNKIYTMSESFKLKPGQQIMLHSKFEIIHERNLESDEMAIELLSQNKQLIAAFISYPEDWEKKVDALLNSGKSEPKKHEAESNHVETKEAHKEKKKK